MSENIDEYLELNPYLHPEKLYSQGVRRFPIRIPSLPEGRSFEYAHLELPKGFPESSKAVIRLSTDAILDIPHVGEDGLLCLDGGDPGPTSEASPVERLRQLMATFFESFLQPWLAGKLDGNFTKEALNYWDIHCTRKTPKRCPIKKIYTVNERPHQASLYEAKLIVNRKLVVTGDDELTNRFVMSMSRREQLSNVLIADIPISHPFEPRTWPRDQAMVEKLLRLRLKHNAVKFLEPHKGRKKDLYKVVIFRAPNCSFGFLLAGGPPFLLRRENSTHAYPNTTMTPLRVERLDPSWTYGRDTQSAISLRQKKNVLVIGTGALGSPVVEQLAKAGIGRLTMIDNDMLSAANIGRHVLGADAIGISKAGTLAEQINSSWPSCSAFAHETTIQTWLENRSLSGFDLVLDLTGEPDVRLCIDIARKQSPCPLLIGWMEPFVAAAHACILPAGCPWLVTSIDRLESLQAVEWPKNIMQKEPSCSSEFQSYTSAAAQFAVALVVEAALDLLDDKISNPIVRHWIRGQAFLDTHSPGLVLREWAFEGSKFDGISMETMYD